MLPPIIGTYLGRYMHLTCRAWIKTLLNMDYHMQAANKLAVMEVKYKLDKWDSASELCKLDAVSDWER